MTTRLLQPPKPWSTRQHPGEADQYLAVIAATLKEAAAQIESKEIEGTNIEHKEMGDLGVLACADRF